MENLEAWRPALMAFYWQESPWMRQKLENLERGYPFTADDLRVVGAIVEQLHRHLIRVGDDVIIRQDVPILADDEPGAARLARLILLRIELTEEVFDAAREPLIALAAIGPRPRKTLGLNRDDGRRHVVGDGLERVLRLDERLDLLEGRFRPRLRLSPTQVGEVRAGGEHKAAEECHDHRRGEPGTRVLGHTLPSHVE